jgi:hypothetical protein
MIECFFTFPILNVPNKVKEGKNKQIWFTKLLQPNQK